MPTITAPPTASQSGRDALRRRAPAVAGTQTNARSSRIQSTVLTIGQQATPLSTIGQQPDRLEPDGRARLHPSPRRRAPAAAARRRAPGCSPSTRMPTSRWRGSPARPASRRRCCTTTSRASRTSSSPRSSRAPRRSRGAPSRTRTCLPFEALAGSLEGYLGWIEENEAAYRRLMEGAGSVPEVKSLVDGIRDATSARILAGHRRRRSPAAQAADRRPRLAVVHGRRDPRLARAPGHVARRAPRPAARLAGRLAHRGGRSP